MKKSIFFLLLLCVGLVSANVGVGSNGSSGEIIFDDIGISNTQGSTSSTGTLQTGSQTTITGTGTGSNGTTGFFNLLSYQTTIANNLPVMTQASINNEETNIHWRNNSLLLTATATDQDNDNVYYYFNLTINQEEYYSTINNATFWESAFNSPGFGNTRQYQPDLFLYAGRIHGLGAGYVSSGNVIQGITIEGNNLVINNTWREGLGNLVISGSDNRPSLEVEYINNDLVAILYDSEHSNYTSHVWNGTSWNNDNTYLTGLPTSPRLTVFDYENNVYATSSYQTGYKWNGTGWETNTDITNGLLSGQYVEVTKVNGKWWAVTYNDASNPSITSYVRENNTWVRAQAVKNSPSGFAGSMNNPNSFVKVELFNLKNGTAKAIITDDFLRTQMYSAPKELFIQGEIASIYSETAPLQLGNYTFFVQATDLLNTSNNELQSNTLEVTNTLPVAQNVTITPNNLTDVDDATGSYTYFDADSDPENGTVTQWLVNDVIVKQNNDSLNSTNFAANDNVTYRVIVNDGIQTQNFQDYKIVIQSRDAPTAQIRKLQDEDGNNQSNLVDLDATVPYRWYAANFTSDNKTAVNATLDLNIFSGNDNSTLINQSFDVLNATSVLSNSFTINNYELYNYELTITDEFNLSTVYSGNLQAQNDIPVIQSVETYRGGTRTVCQQATNCQLRINMIEDACMLTPQNALIVVDSPSNTTVLSDNSWTLGTESNGECQFRADVFQPPSTGEYNFTATFTDFGGETDSITGTFTVSVTTVSAPPSLSSPAGGGALVVEQIIQTGLNQSFTVSPDTQQNSVAIGGSFLGEFQVVNTGIQPITVDISINDELTDSAVRDWVSFRGLQEIRDLDVNSGQGVSGNSKFVRYEIDSNSAIPAGVYQVVFDVQGSDAMARHFIELTVSESQFSQFLLFWNERLFSIGETCSDGSATFFSATTAIEENSTVQSGGVSTSDSEPRCRPRTYVTTGNIIVLLVGGFALAGAIINRRSNNNNKPKEDGQR